MAAHPHPSPIPTLSLRSWIGVASTFPRGFSRKSLLSHWHQRRRQKVGSLGSSPGRGAVD
eukprot:779105-Amorphochlora_amoeboformis.AAC.1